MTQKLRDKARSLIESGSVKIIVGYGEGSDGRARALFVTKAESLDALIYDDRCQQNLAVYLTKEEVKEFGRVGIVASLPVLRTIHVLAKEFQLTDDSVAVIGVDEKGDAIDLPDLQSVGAYVRSHQFQIAEEYRKKLEAVEAMSQQERWDFWTQELSNCIKCYACRSACPLCYCTRCTVDCNKPQWIHVPSHELGNLEYHVMRAMHLAGRCTGCGECYRACPLGIPVNLLTMKLDKEISTAFKPGDEEDAGYALATFKPDDKEGFIR